MSSNDPKAYEAATLKCFIDAFEADTAAKRCKFCRTVWLIIAIACGIFVYVAYYKYTNIEIPIMLVVSALGGALASTAGISSGNAKNTEILKPYVDIEAIKAKYRELQT
jgi:hypothetical protein